MRLRMKFDKTSDTGADHVAEISNEIDPAFRRLEAMHPQPDVAIFVGFRCLPEEYGRRTFRRYSKEDNVLYLDMSFSADRYAQLSKEEQRRDLSHAYYRYLADSLRKYRFPDLDVDEFLRDARDSLREVGWLKEAWEIYLCAEGPTPESGPQFGLCACIRCILESPNDSRLT